MRASHAVFQTPVAIPSLDALPGDLLVVDPSDSAAPISVVRPIEDSSKLLQVLQYIDQLELLYMEPRVSRVTPHQLLRQAVRPLVAIQP